MLLACAALLSVQNDRLELPTRLESFYVARRGDETLGIMRERVERAHGSPWRYAYRFRLELATSGAMRDDSSAEALLDDAFLPLYAETARWSDAAETETFILPAGEGRKLDRGGELVELSPDDRGLPTLVVYALRQSGRLARPGLVRARLLPGQDLEIEVGPSETRRILGRDASLTKLTFVKPPPAPAPGLEWTEAWADKYGRLVEIRLRGGATIALVEGKDALAASGWFARDGRRDPMKRPTRFGRPTIDAPAVPDVDPHAIDSLLRGMEKRLEELKDETTYRGLLGEWKAIRTQGTPAQVATADAIRDRMEAIWGGAARAREEARRLLVDALRRFEALDVEELDRDLSRLRAIAARLELEGRPERLDVLHWVAEARALSIRGRTRRELAALPLHVSGTTLSDTKETLPLDLSVQVYGHVAGDAVDVPFIRHEVYAAVNGRLYRPGDFIQGTAVRLEKISRHSVLFSLRDELRDVPLR